MLWKMKQELQIVYSSKTNLFSTLLKYTPARCIRHPKENIDTIIGG